VGRKNIEKNAGSVGPKSKKNRGVGGSKERFGVPPPNGGGRFVVPLGARPPGHRNAREKIKGRKLGGGIRDRKTRGRPTDRD